MSQTFDASLIQSWAAIERRLTDVWDRYIAQNRERRVDGKVETFINAKRTLTGGRDFTISIVSEILSLLDLIPSDLYQRLAPVRRARNDWMHALTPVSGSASAQSLHVAFDLLRAVDGIDLDPVPEIMFSSGV
jgi:hypothetical protein